MPGNRILPPSQLAREINVGEDVCGGRGVEGNGGDETQGVGCAVDDTTILGGPDEDEAVFGGADEVGAVGREGEGRDFLRAGRSDHVSKAGRRLVRGRKRTEVWPSLAAKEPVLVQLSVETMTISARRSEGHTASVQLRSSVEQKQKLTIALARHDKVLARSMPHDLDRELGPSSARNVSSPALLSRFDELRQHSLGISSRDDAIKHLNARRFGALELPNPNLTVRAAGGLYAGEVRGQRSSCCINTDATHEHGTIRRPSSLPHGLLVPGQELDFERILGVHHLDDQLAAEIAWVVSVHLPLSAALTTRQLTLKRRQSSSPWGRTSRSSRGSYTS